MKLKMLLMASCLLLPISSAFAETVDEYVAGLKKEASIGNTEAQKELDQFQAFSKKANAGDAQAQYDLGIFYKKKAAARDQAAASSNFYVEDGKAYKQKQTEWLLKAALQGNIDAQHELLALYKKKNNNGRNGDNDLTQKIETMLINIAQKGDAKDQYALAEFYMESGNYREQEKAGEWIIKAANQGLEKAQIYLGKGYFDGHFGIEKNYNKAKALFEKLADEKNVEALYYLAKCYQNGYGVAKDEKKAIELYERAANNGDVYAAAFLSKAYLTGIEGIISRNKENFVKYYMQVHSGATKAEYNSFGDDIGKTCIKINNGTDFLKADSTIDPLCRDAVIAIMRN